MMTSDYVIREGVPSMMTSDYVIREGVPSMTHRLHATSAARR
jgi:uncharacterized protein YbaR (Trm112 family)